MRKTYSNTIILQCACLVAANAKYVWKYVRLIIDVKHLQLQTALDKGHTSVIVNHFNVFPVRSDNVFQLNVFRTNEKVAHTST